MVLVRIGIVTEKYRLKQNGIRIKDYLDSGIKAERREKD